LSIMNSENEAEFLKKKLTVDIAIFIPYPIPYGIAFGGFYTFGAVFHGISYIFSNTGGVVNPSQVSVTIQELANQRYGNALVVSNNNYTLNRLARLTVSTPMIIKGIKLTENATAPLSGSISFTYIQGVHNNKILEIPAGKVSRSTVSPNQYNSNITYYNIPELVILDGSSVLVMNMPANIPFGSTFKAEFAIETVARQIEISEIEKIEKKYKELNKCLN